MFREGFTATERQPHNFPHLSLLGKRAPRTRVSRKGKTLEESRLNIVTVPRTELREIPSRWGEGRQVGG